MKTRIRDYICVFLMMALLAIDWDRTLVMWGL